MTRAQHLLTRLHLELCEDRAVPAGLPSPEALSWLELTLPRFAQEAEIAILSEPIEREFASDSSSFREYITGIAIDRGQRGGPGFVPPPSSFDRGTIEPRAVGNLALSLDLAWDDLGSVPAAPTESGGWTVSPPSSDSRSSGVPKPPDSEANPHRPGHGCQATANLPRSGLLVPAPCPAAVPASVAPAPARTPVAPLQPTVPPPAVEAEPQTDAVPPTGVVAGLEESPAALKPSAVLSPAACELLSCALPGIDAADLISRLMPMESGATDAAVDRFLDRLGVGTGATPWSILHRVGLAGVTLAAGLGAGELARRHRLPQRVSWLLSRSRLLPSLRIN